MDLPSMKWKPLMPSISPYALYRTKLEQEAFVPIRMPDRIDGAMLTNKQAAYDHIGKTFTTMKDDMKSGKTEIDRINYALGSYLHQNRGTANLRGLMGDLLEAGFRAPIGAFPSEYLHDLHGRVQLAAKNGNAGNLSASEVKLLDHWQKLKDAGLDPVWLDAKQKQESWVGADKTLESYATRLSGLLTQTGNAAKSAQTAAGYKKTA